MCICITLTKTQVHLHSFFLPGLACALPFRTIFAKQLGISATAVGVIFSVVPFLKIFTNPAFGFILDYFKRIRLTVSVIMVILGISTVSMVFIPPKTLKTATGVNITEDSFQFKLFYLCLSGRTPPFCDPKLVMYNEYRMPFGTTREGRFACDVQCLNSLEEVQRSRLDGAEECQENIQGDFQVLVDISSCDMSVTLAGGRLAIFHNRFHSEPHFSLNSTLAKDINSWTSTSETFSSDPVIKPNPLLRKKITKIISGKNQPVGTDSLEAYISKIMYDANQKVLVDGEKRYFTLYEYTIPALREKVNVSSPCSLEYNCRTQKCFWRQDSADSEQQVENEYLSDQFWGLFFLIAISSVTLSSVIFMMDAVCYELLQDKRDLYGQQRLWGTVGYGVGALVGGYVNQIFTNDSEEINYGPSFFLLGFLMLVDLIPTYFLKVTDLKYSSNIWKDVGFLFSRIDIVYNILEIYFVGALSGFIWNYQFWFMQEIGSSQVLLGLATTFECLFEVPCFLVSGWIIKKIGHNNCNSVTLLFFGLRYLCFVVTYNPWWTLAIAFFHGPTFGLFYPSMTSYAKKVASPGTEATVQSLLHLCFEGVGKWQIIRYFGEKPVFENYLVCVVLKTKVRFTVIAPDFYVII